MADTISNKDLISMGYRPSTANAIIHQARDILVSRGYTFYNRKRLMVVPKKCCERIVGDGLVKWLISSINSVGRKGFGHSLYVRGVRVYSIGVDSRQKEKLK